MHLNIILRANKVFCFEASDFNNFCLDCFLSIWFIKIDIVVCNFPIERKLLYELIGFLFWRTLYIFMSVEVTVLKLNHDFTLSEIKLRVCTSRDLLISQVQALCILDLFQDTIHLLWVNFAQVSSCTFYPWYDVIFVYFKFVFFES